MKNTLLLFTLITFILSCKQKTKEDQVLVTHIEQNLQKEEEKPESNTNKSKQPNWAYDPYGYLIYELDSLGLKYETVTFDEFNNRYKETAWEYLDNSKVILFNVSSDTILNVKNFRFEIDFDDKMNFNENAENHYGGISQMRIIKDNKQIQELRNIEDVRALGVVEIAFYDVNLDGHIDMRFIISEGKGNFYEYYFYNPSQNRFINNEDWEYVRPNRYNKSLKQFITIPYGTAMVGEFALYQLDGVGIKKIKTFHYHPINEKGDSFITIVNHN
jgi:hypothetical protein